ncbi:MAG: DUF262 domain-containing protein [Ignavibacteria bacterium]|jgi:hypothetical protein|nr:DUF262 domain-containing protein [Ignavibacteria bacterium]
MAQENNPNEDNKLKLAITKIGDLLIANKISRNAEGNSIENINLVIPPYQRPYKWTARNAIRLLDDIIEAKNENKETYRIGTLILHYDEKSKDENDKKKPEYNIVDGQQRIITLSLLLEAFKDDKDDKDEKDEKDNIEKNEDNPKKISFLEQSLTDNPYNSRNIPNNFRVLQRRIRNITDDRERQELYKYIKNNCELIVVITDDISEAFQFFDSQNSRGKKLYPHDLLKAYHLREMNDLDVTQTEKTVKEWEDLDQKQLSRLFSDYLYRLKEWIKGNRAWELNEQNIHKFKGITSDGNYPYAQFFKGAYAYAQMINNSAMPFVSGMQNLKPFQLDAPLIAGKAFFDYAQHYFEILKDIQSNNKYEGYFISDNEIVKTLDLEKYKNGVGNGITRLLFDTAVLLYVDRFCPTERPSKIDIEMLENRFVVHAFIWAYSLRAQYQNLGWQSAQNYIMGNDKINSFNIYKMIADADSPASLLSSLSDKLSPLPKSAIRVKEYENMKEDLLNEKDENDIYQYYLHYFKEHNFIQG